MRSIADGVQLGVQAASAAPDAAVKNFFYGRLAAVRWAFRRVVSTITSSDRRRRQDWRARFCSNTGMKS